MQFFGLLLGVLLHLVAQHCHLVAACVTFLCLAHAGITLHDEPLDWAAAGDHVNLTVTGMDIIKIKLVQLLYSCFHVGNISRETTNGSW